MDLISSITEIAFRDNIGKTREIRLNSHFENFAIKFKMPLNKKLVKQTGRTVVWQSNKSLLYQLGDCLFQDMKDDCNHFRLVKVHCNLHEMLGICLSWMQLDFTSITGRGIFVKRGSSH